jgi:hypothetical protein
MIGRTRGGRTSKHRIDLEESWRPFLASTSHGASPSAWPSRAVSWPIAKPENKRPRWPDRLPEPPPSITWMKSLSTMTSYRRSDVFFRTTPTPTETIWPTIPPPPPRGATTTTTTMVKVTANERDFPNQTPFWPECYNFVNVHSICDVHSSRCTPICNSPACWPPLMHPTTFVPTIIVPTGKVLFWIRRCHGVRWSTVAFGAVPSRKWGAKNNRVCHALFVGLVGSV